MKTIKQTYTIKTSPKKVWQALVSSKEINNWGAGPAKMSSKVNAKFSLWGGSIWGKNIEVIENKKLAQEWFSESDKAEWTEPSIATFTLTPKKGSTRLELKHEHVPKEDLISINQGWKDYYLGPLKEYLEREGK